VPAFQLPVEVGDERLQHVDAVEAFLQPGRRILGIARGELGAIAREPLLPLVGATDDARAARVGVTLIAAACVERAWTSSPAHVTVPDMAGPPH